MEYHLAIDAPVRRDAGGEFVLLELLENRDFAEDYHLDELYKSRTCLPEIRYDLFKHEGAGEYRVSRIQIKLVDWGEFVEIKFQPYELFTESFWRRNCPPAEGTEQSYMDDFVLSFAGHTGRIWNGYCLLEGHSTMTREAFVVWLNKLNIFVRDLIDYRLLKQENLALRLDSISQYVIYEAAKDCDLFDAPHRESEEAIDYRRWYHLLARKTPTPKEAMHLRAMDAMDLLNEFYTQVEPLSPLEQFLISCYTSLSEKLCRDQLITKCGFCGKHIPFIKGRMYCTELKEGRSCGKRAANRRYYKGKGQKRLPKYRETTRDLRAFYREMGVHK